MAQVTKISYADKSNPVAVTDRPTQATAEDFNEIKSVTNNCVDGVNWIKCNEEILTAGDNDISFLAPYPSGLPYVIIVSKCIDSNGYLIGHTISNKSENGFRINVNSDCILIYLACPQR